MLTGVDEGAGGHGGSGGAPGAGRRAPERGRGRRHGHRSHESTERNNAKWTGGKHLNMVTRNEQMDVSG